MGGDSSQLEHFLNFTAIWSGETLYDLADNLGRIEYRKREGYLEALYRRNRRILRWLGGLAQPIQQQNVNCRTCACPCAQ